MAGLFMFGHFRERDGTREQCACEMDKLPKGGAAVHVRQAREADVEALILMRWEFTLEHDPQVQDDYELFATECRAFLLQAIRGERWHVWLAETEGVIASHAYIQLVDKVVTASVICPAIDGVSCPRFDGNTA